MLNKEEEEKTDAQKSIEQSYGLYEQLKNNKTEPPTKYTKEYLTSVFKEVFSKVDNNPNRKVNLPLEWKHCEWEENGKQYSYWKLMAGGLFCVLTTGDSGKEEFDKLMSESLKDIT